MARIMVVIDFDNVNERTPGVTDDNEFCFAEGYRKLMPKIKEWGEVVAVMAFCPPHLVVMFQNFLAKEGIFTVFCPKDEEHKTEAGDPKDTVDQTIISYCKAVLMETTAITHICLFSGDADFVPVLRELEEKGKKIIIAAANPKSLAIELAEMAEIDPATGERRILYLNG